MSSLFWLPPRHARLARLDLSVTTSPPPAGSATCGSDAIARLPDHIRTGLCEHVAYASCFGAATPSQGASTEHHTLFYPPPFYANGMCLHVGGTLFVAIGGQADVELHPRASEVAFAARAQHIFPGLAPLAKQDDRVKRASHPDRAGSCLASSEQWVTIHILPYP